MAGVGRPVLPAHPAAEPAPFYPPGLRAGGDHGHVLLRHQQDPGGGGDPPAVPVAGARRGLCPGLPPGAAFPGDRAGHRRLRHRLLPGRRGLLARSAQPQPGGDRGRACRRGVPVGVHRPERVGPPPAQALDGPLLCLPLLRGGLQPPARAPRGADPILRCPPVVLDPVHQHRGHGGFAGALQQGPAPDPRHARRHHRHAAAHRRRRARLPVPRRGEEPLADRRRLRRRRVRQPAADREGIKGG